MIARFHVRALAEIPDTRVVALVDSIEASSRKLADELKGQAQPYTDLSAALSRSDVHLVIVTTPSGAHMDSAVAAAKAGKHVVVEKPLEITTARCDAIIGACDKNGVQLCTIF